ncbi:MAG: hypothetical protein DRP22_04210, partial [Verrucomicrobia bacterium]
MWLMLAGAEAAEKALPVREITPDDLPLVISNSGLYAIVTDLQVEEPVDAITVNADDVTIIFKGGSLVGGGRGSGTGIVQGPEYRGLTVQEGRIRGWSTGIRAAGTSNHVEATTVHSCTTGIVVGTGAAIRRVTVSNCVDGIVAGQGARLVFSTVLGCSRRGLVAGSDCTIGACTVYDCGDGIAAGEGTVV